MDMAIPKARRLLEKYSGRTVVGRAIYLAFVGLIISLIEISTAREENGDLSQICRQKTV